MLILNSPEPNLVLTQPLPLTTHPASVYLRSLRAGSRPTMEQSLNAIASRLTNGKSDAYTLNWAALKYQHTSAIQAALLENYAPATAQKMMCALRRVLREAMKLGLMSVEAYAIAVDLPSIKDSRKLRGRALTQSEISALMEVCALDQTLQGVRDAALIGILRGAGLRRAEVAKLKLQDFNPETGALEVLSGKGGKDRTVYLPQSAIVYLENWLKIRGRQPGALLCPIRKD